VHSYQQIGVPQMNASSIERAHGHEFRQRFASANLGLQPESQERAGRSVDALSVDRIPRGSGTGRVEVWRASLQRIVRRNLPHGPQRSARSTDAQHGAAAVSRQGCKWRPGAR
jgi:hypothetical protein